MKKFYLLLFSLFPLYLYAIDKHPMEFTHPTQETRYQQLTSELRCVVCQNQAIADSNAELAQDMRDLIRQMILQGKTDQEITDFLVERYGDFVLYHPPWKATTYILWIGPLFLFLLALGMLMYFIRQQKQKVPPSLSEEERHQLEQFLKNKDS